jgi:hypothetical protein
MKDRWYEESLGSIYKTIFNINNSTVRRQTRTKVNVRNLDMEQNFTATIMILSYFRRNRFVAYRQLVHWCWGWLGRRIRVPLPACAVARIRKEFPAEDGVYTGFNYDD